MSYNKPITHTQCFKVNIFALLIPLLDFLFVGAVILYRQGRIGRNLFAISGIILLANSIIAAIGAMTASVIYGIPPGVFISIAAPDVDTRFFIPIPLLLVVGLIMSKKQTQSRLEEQDGGPDGI